MTHFDFFKFRCCNSCEEVKEAYRRKGWAVPPLKTIDQCVQEGKTDSSSEKLPEEGCQIYGYLVVNRVSIFLLLINFKILKF